MASFENSYASDDKNDVWAWDKQMEAETERLKIVYEEKKMSTLLVIRLAFQSLGAIYGDIGTSPLYVFYNTFPDGIDNREDIVGALSLIIYSLILIPLLKYVFIVCRANDNGQGGTFALYSLLSRHANIGIIPSRDQVDEKLTTYSRSRFSENSFAAKTKRWLEGHACAKNALLVLVLVGSCMVIGDGILTPAISVLSAVGGIKIVYPKISDELVVLVAVLILIALFSIQHHGIDKVSRLFSPILLTWFLLIGGIGIFNIWKYDSGILKAFSPVYMYRYMKRGGKENFISLGGIMLSITGTEALFVNLSNISVPAIQIAFTAIVFPCLLLAYSGQAAYLVQNSNHVDNSFYHSIPDGFYWPMLVVATTAAVAASQATICATFSLIKQALALGYFPRVKVLHTSNKFHNQIYIPDMNWILMILCVGVTATFKNQSQIGNATGTAVVAVMLMTTFLIILIMLLVWHWHWIFVLIFTVLSLAVEGTYFSAVLFKVNQGGWVPLVIAAAFFIVMWIWNYGAQLRYESEVHSKISTAWILGLGPSLGLARVPGMGLMYTELASGIPHIFSHLITNLPAIHSVVIFVCVKYVPVYIVPEGERFIVTRVGPKEFHMFRCIARYGYNDHQKKDDEFETKLLDNLFRFVKLESLMDGGSDSDFDDCSTTSHDVDLPSACNESIVPSESLSGRAIREIEEEELEFLKRSRDAGVVHILGNTVVKARRDSNIFKKIAIDYMYAFLKKMCRENSAMFYVPHESLLNVGQIIYV